MRSLCVLALWACLSACEGATGLLVVVDSDVHALAGVRIDVSGFDGQPPDVRAVHVRGNDGVAVPFSFGVTPRGGDAGRRAQIMITAERDPACLDDPSGRRCGLVTRTARTGFIEHKRLRLPMFLWESCIGVVCPGDETCAQGVCVSAEVDEGTLENAGRGTGLDGPPEWPGLALDAAVPADAQPFDGALMDADVTLETRDAGRVDAGRDDASALDGARDAAPSLGPEVNLLDEAVLTQAPSAFCPDAGPDYCWDDAYLPENLFDGVLVTPPRGFPSCEPNAVAAWSSSDPTNGETLTFTLARPAQIERLWIQNYGEGRPCQRLTYYTPNVTIYADEIEVIPFHSLRQDEEGEHLLLSVPVAATTVRFVMQCAQTPPCLGMVLGEIQIFGRYLE